RFFYYYAIINVCKYEKDNVNKYKEEYEQICWKLIKNLLLLSDNKYSETNYMNVCRILNEWLYYLKKRYNIPDAAINKLFSKAKDLTPVSRQGNNCYYYPFNKDNKKSEYSMKLNYLVDNVNIIYEILMNKNDPQFCYAQRFAQECKNIYKYMNTIYCSDNKGKEAENIITCSELTSFNTIYTSFLFNKGDINNHIPSLSSDNSEKLVSCESDKRKQEISELPVPLPNHDDNESSSKAITAPTVLGTMAGIPPFLALIYKVNKFLL
ncbi:hypothetical protein PCYB_006780, partial [Plasmodium cynomolgi strain B]